MANQTSTELRQDHQPAILTPTRFGGFPGPVRAALPGNKLIKLLGTTDAKQIGPEEWRHPGDPENDQG